MTDSMVLTCICCRHTFSSMDDQRAHYHSDYHRFNLKRKVVDLPPVSEELFQQKVNELKDKAVTKEIFTGYCNCCKKNFSNERTYNGHIKSKKHKQVEQKTKATSTSGDKEEQPLTSTHKKRVEIETEESKVARREENEKKDEEKTEEEIIKEKMENAHTFDLTECLFCSQTSKNFTKNVAHMTKEHGLFIPDIEFIVDFEGLVSYLGQKVGTGNVCLYCNRIFKDTEAVQNHMRSLNHSKLKYDDEDLIDELEEFYDFSKTWDIEENNADMEDGDGITKSKRSEDALVTTDEMKDLIIKTGKGILDIDDDGYSMTLASGKKIGHRDLLIYYKQNYRRLDARDPNALKSTINRYKALGWKTQVSVNERRARSVNARLFYKQQMQVSVKCNKLQKHFREQVDY